MQNHWKVTASFCLLTVLLAYSFNSISFVAADNIEQESNAATPVETPSQVLLDSGLKGSVESSVPFSPTLNSGTATQAETTHKESLSTSKTQEQKPSPKSAMLFGRIEELCSGTGATLPLKLKSLQPITDNTALKAGIQNNTLSGKANNTILKGKALESYPIEFKGTWSGPLTIFSSNFDPIRWEFDKKEADRESKLMKPGSKGQCTVTFYQGKNSSIQLEPCEVVFTTMVESSQLKGQMQQLFGNSTISSMLGTGGASSLSAQVPYMYALHLGNLVNGVGVTGNQLQSQLLKNQLKQLVPGVLEQVVVTHDSDRNPTSNKVRRSYSESVLRFTRIDANRLYLQAASVNYRNDGRFEDKVILYGTLTRVSGNFPSATPTGNFSELNGANGFQQIQQIQKMMQQLQNLGN